MDLLEMALNPRKALQRMSPFFNKLPEGQARKLEYYFGDRASADVGERVLYSRDASAPPATLNLLLKRDAWAVVRPNVRGELLELIAFANQNGVPIVPRGAGTSGYGGSVPTEGGIVVDLRAFNKVLEVDKAGLKVRCEANVTFAQLDKALQKEGLTLRQYPTSYHAATVAGWVSQGGGGVGSMRYGPFSNDVVEALLMAPDGKLRRLKGADLELVDGTFGTAGFLLEVVLRVRVAQKETHFLASFDEGGRARNAARRIALEAKPYNLVVFTPEYAGLVNQAAGSRLLPQKHGVLVTFEGNEPPASTEVVKGVVLTEGGTMAKEADAQKAWDNRFNHLNLKRLGPSVIVAEAAVRVERLHDAMDAAWKAHRMERACLWAIGISPNEMDVIFYGLDDERRGTYPLAMGNALAVIDAVKAKGGRSYSTGVLASTESEAVLDGGSATLFDRMKEPARGATVTLGSLLGSALLWVAMAYVATSVLHMGAPADAEEGTLTAALSAFDAQWTGFTRVFDAGLGLVLLQAAVIGFAVGMAVFGGLVFNLYERGEPLLNFVNTMLIGGAVMATVHLGAQVYLVGFSLWGLLIAVLAGALGSLWVFPLAVAQWILLGKHQGRLGRLYKHRKKADPREVFNPGPVLGPRTRLMPLPVHDFTLQMRLAAPMLKMQRGLFVYQGGDKADPSLQAYGRALGRVHGGNVGELATEVTSCIFCGMCNAVSPEGQTSPWESAMPRGRVQLAKAVVEGRATISTRTLQNVAWTSLQHAPDAVCPVAIPIQRVTDYLLAAGVDANGALPAHKALADSYAASGNAYGKAADQRSKWVNVGFDAVSPTVFVADDAAAFETPEVAQSAALVLLNAGYPVSHMGKDDAGSAAVLFETGQRRAAEAAVAPFLEKLAKRGAKAVVTPDANGARAMQLDWPLVARANDVAAPTALHTATLFSDLLRAKKLEMDEGKKLGRKAVVHVPEGLSLVQRAAVVEVAKATGATLVPCDHHECGQGRGLKEYDAAFALSMAESCLRAAMAAGAEVILTMNPGCLTSLRSAAKKAKVAVEVLDLHVVVAQGMKAKEGGVSAAPVAAPAEDKKPVEPEIPPDHFRVEFVKEGVILAVHKNQNLLAAGADVGLDLPSSCKAGSCDTCSAKWEGSAPDQSAGSALSPDQQKTYVLTCIARPRGPVKIWSDERP